MTLRSVLPTSTALRDHESQRSARSVRIVLIGVLAFALAAIMPSADGSAATAIGGLDAVAYPVASDGTVRIAPNATLPEVGYADGHVLIEASGDADEQLTLHQSGAPITEEGAISVVGTAVYLGLGAGDSKQIGTIDSVLNGTNGQPLRINLAAALDNADFSGGVDGNGHPVGWTINGLDGQPIVLDDLALRTQGLRAVGEPPGAGWLTLSEQGGGWLASGIDLHSDSYSFFTDVHYSGILQEKEGSERRVAHTSGYTFPTDPTESAEGLSHSSVAVVSESGRFNALRLKSTGWCEGPNASFNDTYCSVFGPEAWSSPFEASEGDDLSFDWRAVNIDDDYEVYAFLVDSQTNQHHLLLHGRGEDQAWTTASGAIPSSSTYRFRFVNGSYDQTGGRLLGSEMYIDNIRVVSDDVTGPVVEQILRLAEFGYANPEPADSIDLTRSVTLTATQPGGETSTGTVGITMSELPQVLTFSDPGALVYGDTVTLHATSTSGLAVTVQGTPDVCEVTTDPGNEHTLTLVGSGTCTLQATQAGTTIFAPAPVVSRTATVQPRPLRVDGTTPVSRPYDGTTQVALTDAVLRAGDLIDGDEVVLEHADSASIPMASIGTHPVTPSMSIAGEQADRYALQQPAVSDVTITRRALHLIGHFSVAAREYDRTTTAVIDTNGLDIDDVVANDVVQLSEPVAAFDGAEVGTQRTVTLTDASLTGDDADNYELFLTNAPTTTADILTRPVTIAGSFSAHDKAYDGGATAHLDGDSLTLDNAVAPDDVRLADVEVAFDGTTAQTGRTVSITAASLTGAAADNYLLSLTGAPTATASIDRRDLHLTGFRADDKVYDGTTHLPAGTSGFDDDRVTGDDLEVTYVVAFADRNVGADVGVSFTDLTLSGGDDVGNYTLITGTGESTAAILPRPLVLSGFVAAGKVYDGTLTVSGTGFGDNRVSGDQLVLGHQAAFTSTAAGTRTVQFRQLAVTGGADAGNYLLATTSGTTTASITPRSLVLSGFVAADKTYDGTRRVSGTGFDDNRIAGDLLTFDYAASFDTARAGTTRTVSFSELRVSGAAAGNYRLAATSGQATATIRPRTLTLSNPEASDRTYDATTSVSGAKLSNDRLEGDELQVGFVARFDNPTAGTGRTVHFEDLALSGPDAANYRLGVSSLRTTATIRPRPAPVIDAVVPDRVHDGTRDAQITGARVTEIVTGDDAVLSAHTTGRYAHAGPGTDIAVSTSMLLVGSDAGNYTLKPPTLTGTILPAPAPEPEDDTAGDGDAPVIEAVPDEDGRDPEPGQVNAEVDGTLAAVEVIVDPTPGGATTVIGQGFTLGVSRDDTGRQPGDDGDDPAPGDGTDTPDGSQGAQLVLERGRSARITAEGFTPASQVRLWLLPGPRLLGEFQTGPDGALDAVTDLLPDDITACAHTLHVEGSLTDGTTLAVSLGVWIDAQPYPFDDVTLGNVHRRPIGCLTDLGVIHGTTSTTFLPGRHLTRGQAASLFARLLDLEPDGDSPYPDTTGNVHEPAIIALSESRIVIGQTTGEFGPEEPVTRAQLASMAARMLDLDINNDDYPEPEHTADPYRFPDAGETHGAAITALAHLDVVHGYDDGTFGPDHTVTRAQTASMLVRSMPHLDPADTYRLATRSIQ